MKKLVFFGFIFLGINVAFCANQSTNQNELYNLVNEYRKGGITSIKSALEKYLLDKNYWSNYLAKKDTRFGYFENMNFIFVASKSKANLALYKIDGNTINLLNQTSAIFGSNGNDKMVEGDLATPIGAYDLTAKLKNLDQYYGPLAFVTAYPNLYDRLQKKTGYGIWIHGLPLNGERDKDTKGCIAIDNATLSRYEKEIDYKKTILITYPNEVKEVSKDALATILQGIFVWRDAWINNDLDLYLSFYDNNFVRFDGMKIAQFRDYKKRVFAKDESKTIDFSNINIAPYPNLNGLDLYRVRFLEDYKAKGGYKFNGIKELYVVVSANKMRIMVER